MSDSKLIWMVLWKKAASDPACRAPFEIDEVVPEAARPLGDPPKDAKRIISGLLKELERMPDGRQFFCQEGEAVVPLPEFRRLAQGRKDGHRRLPLRDLRAVEPEPPADCVG